MKGIRIKSENWKQELSEKINKNYSRFMIETRTDPNEVLSFLEEIGKNRCVVVFCYNRSEVWKSRESAMKFYKECAEYCDGCEAERYSSVFFSLFDRERIAYDD